MASNYAPGKVGRVEKRDCDFVANFRTNYGQKKRSDSATGKGLGGVGGAITNGHSLAPTKLGQIDGGKVFNFEAVLI